MQDVGSTFRAAGVSVVYLVHGSFVGPGALGPIADPVERFKAGAIVPEEGATLLVDYGPPDGTIAMHHAGHAVYTGTKWLLFHAEEVARQFYSAGVQRVA